MRALILSGLFLFSLSSWGETLTCRPRFIQEWPMNAELVFKEMSSLGATIEVTRNYYGFSMTDSLSAQGECSVDQCFWQGNNLLVKLNLQDGQFEGVYESSEGVQKIRCTFN